QQRQQQSEGPWFPRRLVKTREKREGSHLLYKDKNVPRLRQRPSIPSGYTRDFVKQTNMTARDVSFGVPCLEDITLSENTRSLQLRTQCFLFCLHVVVSMSTVLVHFCFL
ncbi:unnamed protein product, partial [Laminaria digitata]